MAKKKKTTSLPVWMTSKYFLLGLAVTIAAIVIIGFNTFASTCAVGNSAGCPTVKSGSTGSTVKVLQNELNATCYTGSSPSLTVDGAFGANTKRAVVGFQGAKGLSQDGVVGPKTWSALQKTYSSKKAQDLLYVCD